VSRRRFLRSTPGLLHFRLLHPVLAIIAGTYVIWLVFKNSSRRMCQSRTSVAIIILLFAQIGIGLLNVFLLAPVWLQILHLLVADTIWISLVPASAALVLEDPYARSGRVGSHRTEYWELKGARQYDWSDPIDG
jgi:heme A synthase